MTAATYFNEGHDETRVNVPLDVAVEQPHSGIVAPEAHDNMSIGVHE